VQSADVTDVEPEAGGKQSHLRTAAGIVVSVVSLVAVVWWASRQEAPRFPTAPGELALIVLAVGVYAVATLARGWRWHSVLRRGGVEHQPADAYALVPVGYMGNTVLPARGGEVLRVLLLGERSPAKRREILGSIIGERALDAASLVVLFAVLTFAGVAGNPVGKRPAFFALLALVAGVAGLFAYLALRRRGRFETFAGKVRPVVRAARPLLGPAGLLLGGGTLAVWLMEGLIFWLVGQALDLDFSLLEGCFVLVLTAFFSLVPAAPGYVGTFDAAVIFGLKALDVTGGSAVAFAVLVRFVLFVPITVAGLALLIGRYGGLRRLRRAR
jgi:glycosyltransferase 2 family protein